MITLHILGAGGAVPTAERGPAAYWIDLDGHGVLLDPGPGALVRLVRQPGAVDSVDHVSTVLLSHLHLDHHADLAPLLFAQHSILARAEGTLLVVGPIGTRRLLEGLRSVYGEWLTPRLRRLEIREVAPDDVVDLPGGTARAVPAHHPVARLNSPALGWRFSDQHGHSLGYTGDTGVCLPQAQGLSGCDLLLAECSTPDDLAVDTHLSPAGVVEMVRNIRPGRVVLTHLYPLVADQMPHLAVAARTGTDTVTACDGDVFVIPRETESSS